MPDLLKNQSYVALLGYLKSNTKYIQKDPIRIVELANEFSTALGFNEPPALEAKTIGMMGLRGVPGLRVAAKGSAPGRPGRQGQGEGQGRQGQGEGRGYGGGQNRSVGGPAKRGFAY